MALDKGWGFNVENQSLPGAAHCSASRTGVRPLLLHQKCQNKVGTYLTTTESTWANMSVNGIPSQCVCVDAHQVVCVVCVECVFVSIDACVECVFVSIDARVCCVCVCVYRRTRVLCVCLCL